MMNIINKTAAREAVVEFLTLVGARDELADRVWQMKAPSRVLGSIPQDIPHSAVAAAKAEIDGLETKLRGLQPLIEKIAQEIDPSDDPYRFADWESAKKMTERMLGILDSTSVHENIFAPRGPSLAAEHLHPWVWNAAVDLWRDGHHMEAVLNAAKAVEKHVQLKISSTFSGQDLYGHAFSTKEGPHARLRFTELTPDTETWRSAHEGARFLGMGCSRGIRNWAAHSTNNVSEQQALEYLATLSVLARWADTAQVELGASVNAA